MIPIHDVRGYFTFKKLRVHKDDISSAGPKYLPIFYCQEPALEENKSTLSCCTIFNSSKFATNI
jgi:hypothetical protein